VLLGKSNLVSRRDKSCFVNRRDKSSLQAGIVDLPSNCMLSGRGWDLLQVSHPMNLLLIAGRIPTHLLIPTLQARIQQWTLHGMRQHQSTSHIKQRRWYRKKSYISCRQFSTIQQPQFKLLRCNNTLLIQHLMRMIQQKLCQMSQNTNRILPQHFRMHLLQLSATVTHTTPQHQRLHLAHHYHQYHHRSRKR